MAKTEPQLNFSYTSDQIAEICTTSQKKLTQDLDTLVNSKATTFEKAVLPFERGMTHFSNTTTIPLFLKYVSDNSKIREAADRCEVSTQKYLVDIFAREDLYQLLKGIKVEGLAPEASHLLTEFLTLFKRNGLELEKEKRAAFLEKKKKLVELEAKFNKNLVEWKEFLEVSESELKGLPQSYIESLKKLPNGKYKITLDYPHYFPFMENAESDDARKRLEFTFNNRGGQENRKLLEEAIQLRHEMANLLGYPTHAHFVLDRRMARTPSEVIEFLNRLETKLKIKGKKDLGELVAVKRETLKDPNASEMHAWDWRYFENILKKQQYQVDNEKLKEYFPLPVVLKGMFEIYESLLGVKFALDKKGPRWNKTTQLFKVLDGKRAVALFYMDLFPREGKYTHAAAFPLVLGYRKESRDYFNPVSAIVANFNPPAKGKPALLQHSEVETLFHEFGHIMHQVLTQARFATFSGTSVKTDFVEAPSQMLENWVWKKETLKKLSGFYKDTKKKLPDEWIDRLVGAKLVDSGIRYLRQLSFAKVDMEYHSQANVDSTAIYCKATREIMMIPCQDNTQPQAGFTHLMGGYDAGYYGYLWSKVFAEDMFSRFEKEGLLNPKTGADYRHFILEPGGQPEPMDIIKKFLKREPNEEAFFRSLGV